MPKLPYIGYFAFQSSRFDMNTAQLLSASVAPVVLISAGGLITLALYNRLGAILGRIRAFHQQKFELLKDLSRRQVDGQELLVQRLDSQIAEVTLKAKTIRKGLYCMLAAIAAFLVCSPCATAAAMQEWFGWIALSMHFLGVALFLCGIGWSICELTMSLNPLEEESGLLEGATAFYAANSNSRSSHPTTLPRCCRDRMGSR